MIDIIRKNYCIFQVFVYAIGFCCAICEAATQVSSQKYRSLRSNEVNWRSGPGYENPIEWIYKRFGLPVLVIREFSNWAYIRDSYGTCGWVNKNFLSNKKTVVVTSEESHMNSRPDGTGRTVAILKKGVICRIYKITNGRCYVSTQDKKYSGWIEKSDCWGGADFSGDDYQ
ncbi:SH3 domain-containing protein [Candidatus Hydrogenosomobacter endosymbioticus]|uniref:SH3b domain-containing protein n=1 Tax=Candidatus Hydrogenosomobacter endosymbioticus TaxID=2558174 RepID=A0ABM7V8K7_9PROT|nr:SH3 domain-containing protein [Candidatus Hydrogenosomobacter endosymbioticus]BDB96110.1 hypothetical protein HYD_2430 [Candidatus Hydrogenosomobacter endosymbioticus]